jgi:hypothetical protein
MHDNSTLQRVEHGSWAKYAEAQQLAIEGDRLIAQEIAEDVRGLWRRVMR